MTGKRPLTVNEFHSIHSYLLKHNRIRDLVMVSLLYHTGYRIKEILSMKVKDVYQSDGTVKDYIQVMPRNMKKKTPRPAIAVNNSLRADMKRYQSILTVSPGMFLIQSQKGDNKSISYTQAYRIIKDVFDAKDVYNNVAVHSFRKSFCKKLYEYTGNDIRVTQVMMGHKQVGTTQRYISVDVDKANELIMQMN